MGVFLSGVAAGMWDCVHGIANIRKLDADILREWERQRSRSMGALARRRNKNGTEQERRDMSLIRILKDRYIINIVYVLITIVIFYFVFLPLLLLISSYICGRLVQVVRDIMPVLTILFEGLWVMPLIVLMEIINAKFYLDVSSLVYTVHRAQRRKDSPTLSFIWADRFFSLVVLMVFLLQTRLVRLVPVSFLNEIAYVMHLSQLYAFYAFEYRWCYEGMAFEDRLKEMETNWNYFLGFGLPLALLCWVAPHWAISAFVMYMVFPLYIISSQQARKHQKFRMTTPLRIFRPSVYVVDWIFDHGFSFLTRLHRMSAARPAST